MLSSKENSHIHQIEFPNYSEPLEPSKFGYYFSIKPGRYSTVADSLIEEANTIASEVGIDSTRIEWQKIPSPQERNYKPSLIMISGLNPLDMDEDDRTYLKELSSQEATKVIVAGIYDFHLGNSSSQTTNQNRDGERIKQLENELNIFIPWPNYFDALYQGVQHPDAQRIADGYICDGIRVFYPLQRSQKKDDLDSLVRHQDNLGEHIRRERQLRNQYSFWHRAPSDGCSVHIVDNGFLITQTSTDKTTITPEQYSYMPFKGIRGSYQYSGTKMPTSDIEAILLLQELNSRTTNARHLFHAHHENITQNPYFSEKVTEKFVPYGREESAEILLEEFVGLRALDDLEKNGLGWVIAKDHGIFAVYRSITDLETFVSHLSTWLVEK